MIEEEGMALIERYHMVKGSIDLLKRWTRNQPYKMQIKIYGSKKYEKYITPQMEFFCIEEGVRITVPLTDVLDLIKDYEDADPAEEDRDKYEHDDE
jgi:hypothetical protein